MYEAQANCTLHFSGYLKIVAFEKGNWVYITALVQISYTMVCDGVAILSSHEVTNRPTIINCGIMFVPYPFCLIRYLPLPPLEFITWFFLFYFSLLLI